MNYLELEKKHIADTYTRQPITLVEGDGVKVKDSEGNEYLDFVSGLAVTSLGHANPEIAKALSEQAEKLVHTSNLYHIQEQVELGKKLAEITPESIQKFFFCNSGTEAVEAALKLAIRHTGREKIVALEKSFHGRTSGSLGITWKTKYKEPYKSLVFSGGKFTPLNDLEKAKVNIDNETAAFIAEPVQGEGGVQVVSKDFLQGVKEICEEKEALLILDEVQCGMGRTGKWFVSEHLDVEPDIMTMAKALGNGFPIGSMGAKPEIMDSFKRGDHASTFGGNPLACKVGKTVIETMEKENIPKRVEKVGGYFKKELEKLAEDYEMIHEVRGLGLMLAIVMENKEIAEDALDRAREDGFLINRTSENVLRFVPPLIVEEKHIDQLISELDQIFRRLNNE